MIVTFSQKEEVLFRNVKITAEEVRLKSYSQSIKFFIFAVFFPVVAGGTALLFVTASVATSLMPLVATGGIAAGQ